MPENNIIQEERIYNLKQNGNIKGYKWYVENKNNKAIVVISHGMAEHIERYQEFITFLCENDFIVYGHNHRGHFNSILTDDDYGYMSDEDNFEILVSDLNEIISKIKKENPNDKIFLLGHSMGSFVSQRFAELYGNKINGVILSGSSLNPPFLVSCGKTMAKFVMKIKGRRYRSKFINKLVFGSYNKKYKPRYTDFDWLNRDQEEVNLYIKDRYCGGIFTVSYFYDFFGGLQNIVKNFDLIPKKLPIFIISGDMDPVGGYGRDIRKLYSNLKKKSITDLELIIYKEARHEILKELSKKKTFNDILNWLNKHSQK